MTPTSKQSLSKSDIKKVCDILRRDDGVGAKNYVEQLSWLLFLKVFENVEGELKELANAEGKKYQAIIDSEYQWSTWAKKDWKDKDELVHFVNQKLFPYLKNLKGSKEKDKIGEVFRELSGNLIRSAHNLLDIIDIIDQIEMKHFQDTHLLSQVYEEILQEMGSEGGWAGEFYTPRPIIRLMVKVVNPKIGEAIFDPFVGSGGFLIESFDYIQKQTKNIGVKEWNTLQNKTFSGQEKTPLPYLIGTMNMMLHRIMVPDLTRTNTFMEDVHNISEGIKKDIILTNPPFGGKEHLSVQNNFPIPIGATEGLALQYVMRHLKNGGRCGIILPEGQILFGGGAFQIIRQELLEKFNIHSIISLPAGAFSQMGAGVKTNLIFFEKTGPTKEIWYGEVNGRFTKKQKMQDSDFEEVFSKWQKREVSESSWITPISKIKERGFDISPKNPIKEKQEELLEPIEIVNKLKNSNQQKSEILNKIEEELKKINNKEKIKTFHLEEIAKFQNGYAFKSGDFNKKDGFLVIKMGNVDTDGKLKLQDGKSSYISKQKAIGVENFILNKGDLIITMTDVSRERRLIGHTAIIDKNETYILNQRVGRIVPNEEFVLREYLHYYTNSLDFIEYIKSNSSGVLQFNTSTKAIKEALIPIPMKNNKPDIVEQKRIADRLDKLYLQVNLLEKKHGEQLSDFNRLKQSTLSKAFEIKL